MKSKIESIKRELKLEINKLDLTNKSNIEIFEYIENLLEKLLLDNGLVVSKIDKSTILKNLLNTSVYKFKEVFNLLEDDSIEEIMINGLNGVFIKQRFKGVIEKTDIKFTIIEDLNILIEKLLETTGRRVDKSNPLVDLRLTDGSRCNIILPPLSVNGPIITIRKFLKEAITLDKLLLLKTINKDIKDFLQNLVELRANLLIAGGTGSGKTTTLNAVASHIPSNQRVVVIEETSEIKLLNHANAINLETRLKNYEDKGEVTIRDLVKNSLRMRPDRLIVGEVRGEEAFDMLQSINTGHPGSITTIHANSSQDAISRLTALVMLANFKNLNIEIIQSWVKSTIDIIIYQSIDTLGNRKISEISYLDSNLNAINLYSYKNNKFKKNDKNIKKFLTKMKSKNQVC